MLRDKAYGTALQWQNGLTELLVFVQYSKSPPPNIHQSPNLLPALGITSATDFLGQQF